MNTLYAGIDLHSNNEGDVVVYEKRLKNDINSIVASLAPYADEVVGVLGV